MRIIFLYAFFPSSTKFSPYTIVATDKVAKLVLEAILAQLMCGDVIKAEQIYRRAVQVDPKVSKSSHQEGDIHQKRKNDDMHGLKLL